MKKEIGWKISQEGDLWKAESETGIVVWADSAAKLVAWFHGAKDAGDKS